LICTGIAVLLVSLSGGGAAAFPPGNNGTVKIDGIPFDELPNNQPHVGCIFQVDFYGYDEGDLEAIVRFNLWSPTGSLGVLFRRAGIDIGEDPAGGGRDVDAQLTVDLSAAIAASGVAPHPKQGWHVRLTVNAEGSIGKDVKHKTFWVTGCPPPSPTPTTPPPTTTTPPPTTTTPPPTTTTAPPSSTTSTSPPPSSVTSSSTAYRAGIGGPPDDGAPPSGPLPPVDTTVAWYAAFGLMLLLGAGGFLRVLSRRGFGPTVG
jgi:hypothetical protein